MPGPPTRVVDPYDTGTPLTAPQRSPRRATNVGGDEIRPSGGHVATRWRPTVLPSGNGSVLVEDRSRRGDCRVATRGSHDRVMKNSIPDVAVQRNALLDQRHDVSGLARWARDLVEAAALTAGFQAEVRVGKPPAEWSVEVRTAGRPVLLVDVGTDALDQVSLDRLELRAAHVWRDLTRSAALFEPRPWLGAIRVAEDGATDAAGVERVLHLVATRTLDAACVVALDRPARTVRSSSPVMTIESFQAAVVGRCLVLAAGTTTVRSPASVERR